MDSLLTVRPEHNILQVDPNDFDYDVASDTLKPRNLEAFEQMIEEHPSVHTLKRDDKREGKVANLKKKILDTLKVEERKKRDLSCDSVKSDCSGWGLGGAGSDRDKSPGSRGETRHRSEDEEMESQVKKSMRKSRKILKPPKIVLSKQQK